MSTLFNSDLSCRDFASHLLYVPDLLDWTKSKRLHLRTTPPIDDYEFVQAESLLCAIERHANDLTPEQALEIVLNDPVLKNDPVLQKYPDDIDPRMCRWLLGATAHRKWRELLSGAIQNQELSLLDFGSRLPIQTAPVVTASDGLEPPATNWQNVVRAEAWEQWVKTLAENGTPTLENVAKHLAVWCVTNEINGNLGRPPKAGYMQTHVIGGKYWQPPRGMTREAAKKHLKQK